MKAGWGLPHETDIVSAAAPMLLPGRSRPEVFPALTNLHNPLR